MTGFTHRLPHQPWSKPSRNEDRYFQREEFRRRMEAAKALEARRAQEERARWLATHGGHCPRCGARLEALDSDEKATEQCPCCLGVWMEYETFADLTQLHPRNEYLTGILRGLALQWTTGEVKAIPPRDDPPRR